MEEPPCPPHIQVVVPTERAQPIGYRDSAYRPPRPLLIRRSTNGAGRFRWLIGWATVLALLAWAAHDAIVRALFTAMAGGLLGLVLNGVWRGYRQVILVSLDAERLRVATPHEGFWYLTVPTATVMGAWSVREAPDEPYYEVEILYVDGSTGLLPYIAGQEETEFVAFKINQWLRSYVAR